MFKQFDIVSIKTSKNVPWMSKPKGSEINPHGKWSVVGSQGVFLILCKEGVLIKIPFTDVEKLADYNIEKLFEEIKNGKGQGRQERRESGEKRPDEI